MLNSTLLIVGAYLIFAAAVATPVGIVACHSAQRGGTGTVKGHLIGGAVFTWVVIGLCIAAFWVLAITAGGG